LSANFFKAPFDLSVMAIILSLAATFPYFFSICCFKILNAIAGSVVVPDFETTAIAYSFLSSNSNKSAK